MRRLSYQSFIQRQYSGRHLFGWEFRVNGIPFYFDSRDDFLDFMKTTEIEANWLNCLAELNRDSKCPKQIQSRLMQFISLSETDYKSQFSKDCRLIPSKSLFEVVSVRDRSLLKSIDIFYRNFTSIFDLFAEKQYS